MEDFVKKLNRLIDLVYVILAVWAIAQGVKWMMILLA